MSKGRRRVPTKQVEADKKAPCSRKNTKKPPPSRTWIYAAASTPASFSSREDPHLHYLHQRVQRMVVRSLPGNYSYFQRPHQSLPARSADFTCFQGPHQCVGGGGDVVSSSAIATVGAAAATASEVKIGAEALLGSQDVADGIIEVRVLKCHRCWLSSAIVALSHFLFHSLRGCRVFESRLPLHLHSAFPTARTATIEDESPFPRVCLRAPPPTTVD